MDREVEVRHLTETDAGIVAAERNVTKQHLLIEKLRRDGHDIRLAQKILKQFECTLVIMLETREKRRAWPVPREDSVSK